MEVPAAVETPAAMAAPAEPVPTPARVPAIEVEPALPWETPAPAEAAPSLALPEEELDAMPWSPRYHHEIIQGSPRRVDPLPHPSALPGALPQGPNWGLPWPRPTLPTDGLAVHDPALWSAKERIAAVRDDLAARGSASFGAVKPEGSAWLKRIQHFGGP